MEIAINDKISYIPCSEDPLCADIGIIREGGVTWLFDVGDGASNAAGLTGNYHIVLSHFHRDHTGNVGSVRWNELFVSRETQTRVHVGTIVNESLRIGNLHIFPLPSSHCKGCLGLEVDGTYAFVGDAIYCRSKNGRYTYNATLLQDEIAVLKSLRAPWLLLSHHDGLLRSRAEVITELEEIYAHRRPNEPEIEVR